MHLPGNLLPSISVLATVLITASTCPAGYMGHTVTADYHFPSLGTVYFASGTAVVSSGVEFDNIGGFGVGVSPSVDISDTNILITYPVSWNLAQDNKTFDGFVISDVFGSIPAISGATLASTNIAGFGNSLISFDADRVYINQLGFQNFAAGSYISVDVTFVPEPGSLALTGLGLAGFLGACLRSRRHRGTLLGLGLLGLLALDAGSTSHAQTTATWLNNGIGPAFWSNPTRWTTNPFYPNNGNPEGVTYDAVVNGNLNLDLDVTIERLTLSGGSIGGGSNRTLTLNNGVHWTDGFLLNGPKASLHGNSIFAAPQFGLQFYGDVTNHGHVALTGPATYALYGGAGYVWTNAAGSLFDIQGDAGIATLGAGPRTAFINQSGAVLRKSSGIGSPLFNWSLDNAGTIEVLSGTLNPVISYTQSGTGALLVAENATFRYGFGGAGTLSLAGVIGGSGTIDAETVFHNNGSVTPGMSIGRLAIDGNLRLGAASLLDFELGAGGTGDRLDVFGNLVLDGILDLSTEADLDDGLYTLITWMGSLDDRGVILGQTPTGYNVELIVDPTLKRVLASVSVIPEPTSWLLLGGGLVVARPLVRRWRCAG